MNAYIANRTAEFEFTIIVPVFDEEDNLQRLESELSEYLLHALKKSCVLFVDDGSRDRSRQLLQEICGRHDDMFFLSFRKNAGLSAALKAGIDHTFSPLTGYIDADLQTSPEDFNLLLPYTGEFALVTGIRAGRKDSFVKKASSKIANSFRRMMTHDNAVDTGCPLKVMQTAYAKRLPLFTGMHRFIPALILLQDGGQFKQLPVRHFPRTAGASKYHLWNRLAGPFKDCFAYRWMKKRYINYQISDSNL